MAKVSEKWGQGQPGPAPDPNLLPKIGPAKTTPAVLPNRPAPVTPKIWSPPNIKVSNPQRMPKVGKG